MNNVLSEGYSYENDVFPQGSYADNDTAGYPAGVGGHYRNGRLYDGIRRRRSRGLGRVSCKLLGYFAYMYFFSVSRRRLYRCVAIPWKKGYGSCLFICKAAIYTTTAVATFISLVVIVFRFPLLDALFGDVEADVMRHAQSYFLYVALSFPFLAMYDAGAALFRAMGNSMVSMSTSLVMNVLNLIGNAILIFGFGMGAAGAAIATLFSRIVGAFVIIVLLHKKDNVVHVERIFHFRPDFSVIKRILRIGVPSGVENSMFQFGKLLTQTLISSMGTASIAANAVAHTLATFQYMPGNAIGLATVTVVGRCIGAQEKEQATKYSRLIVGLTYLFLWLVILLTVLLAKPVIGIYALSAEASEMAYSLIIYHAICAAIIWPISFTLPGSFRAASDVKFPLIVSVVSMWLLRVALSYVLAPVSTVIFGVTVPGLGWGVMGVWVAMTADWLFRAVFFLYRHFSGKWLTKYRAHEKTA